MTAHRSNSWTSQEDTLLAEAIVTSVRNGRTIGDACRAVAGQLGRTPGACMFRWTQTLRTVYQAQLEAARRERLGNGLPVTPANTDLDPSLLLQSIHGYLNTFDHEYHRLISHVQTLVAKRDRLRITLDKQATTVEPNSPASLEQLHQDAQLLAQTLTRTNKVLEQK